MSPDALVLAMRAHARPLPRGRARLRVGLSLTDSRVAGRPPADYVSELTVRSTTILRATLGGHLDATISSTTAAWKALVITSGTEDAPNVTITGDADAAAALLTATRFQRQ